jgi:hypothetical protein
MHLLASGRHLVEEREMPAREENRSGCRSTHSMLL